MASTRDPWGTYKSGNSGYTFISAVTESRNDKIVCDCKTLFFQIKLFSSMFSDDYTEYHATSVAVFLLLGSLLSADSRKC